MCDSGLLRKPIRVVELYEQKSPTLTPGLVVILNSVGWIAEQDLVPAKPTMYALRPADMGLKEFVDFDRSRSPEGFWIFSPLPYLRDSFKWLGFAREMIIGDERIRLAWPVLIVHIVSS